MLFVGLKYYCAFSVSLTYAHVICQIIEIVTSLFFRKSFLMSPSSILRGKIKKWSCLRVEYQGFRAYGYHTII